MKLNIGENLKKLRSEKNITQEALAQCLGVSSQAVSRWETGIAYPDIELLPEIARIFDVSMEKLMGTEHDVQRISRIVSEMSSLQFSDNRTAQDTLRALEKENPGNWEVRTILCSALLESGEYDRVMPEMRRYGYEARLRFDREEILATQWLYRSIVLAAPEDEVEEWADQFMSTVWITREAAMLLRYTDYRKDVDKARYWEGRAILQAVSDLDGQFRNPFQTPEGWINANEMAIRLYDAIAGIPCRKNGAVCNTLYLPERIQSYLAVAYHAGLAGQTEKLLPALRKAVDCACLYADSLDQDRLTADTPYFDIDADYMAHDRQYDLVDYVMKCVENIEKKFPGTAESEEFRAMTEQLREKQREVDARYGELKKK